MSNQNNSTRISAAIGRPGTYKVNISDKNAIVVDVSVADTRQSYGRTEFLIQPTAGTGQAWVSSKSVKLAPLAKAVAA